LSKRWRAVTLFIRAGGDDERRRFQHQHPQVSQEVGCDPQREIEKAVRQGLAEGKLKGNEKLPAEATVTLGGIGLSLEIKGEINLDE
jgi:hypothetical protein